MAESLADVERRSTLATRESGLDETQNGGFRPPYLSFRTFWSLIEELTEKPLPPKLDRSMLDRRSGTDQAGLIAALKGFGLIDEDQVVQPSLVELTDAEPEQRKKMLESMLREHYPRQFDISEQPGTEQMLLKSFEEEWGLTGDTRRKAVTFFLHAARHADLELSPHFPNTRAGSGRRSGSRATKSTRTAKRKSTAEKNTDPEAPPARPKGDSHTVRLASGGTVSVVVDVDLFALSTDDRDFIIDLVDKLKGYPSPVADSDEDEEDDDA